MAPHSSILAQKIPWRSLVGCSPWGHEELDTTERLDFHFSLSCIGEGNGTPLQCSCLENPRNSGAWWAAVYVVAQSWTRLKRLSSSSSSSINSVYLLFGMYFSYQFSKHQWCFYFYRVIITKVRSSGYNFSVYKFPEDKCLCCLLQYSGHSASYMAYFRSVQLLSSV